MPLIRIDAVEGRTDSEVKALLANITGADDSPSWRCYLEFRKKPSLEPSIWRTTGCHSHFFLRRGQIVWCRYQSWTKQT